MFNTINLMSRNQNSAYRLALKNILNIYTLLMFKGVFLSMKVVSYLSIPPLIPVTCFDSLHVSTDNVVQENQMGAALLRRRSSLD